MITAKEFLRKIGISDSVPDKLSDDGKYWFVDCSEKAVEQALIEFARIKVKEALETAANKVELVDDYLSECDCNASVDKESILNSYDLNNIK